MVNITLSDVTAHGTNLGRGKIDVFVFLTLTASLAYPHDKSKAAPPPR